MTEPVPHAHRHRAIVIVLRGEMDEAAVASRIERRRCERDGVDDVARVEHARVPQFDIDRLLVATARIDRRPIVEALDTRTDPFDRSRIGATLRTPIMHELIAQAV